MISDYDLPMTKYVSVPRDFGTHTPAAFVAGVVRGALDGAGFPARCARACVRVCFQRVVHRRALRARLACATSHIKAQRGLHTRMRHTHAHATA